MRKILMILFGMLIMISLTGCNKESKSSDCCECKDCPEYDVCCSCDNPYLNK